MSILREELLDIDAVVFDMDGVLYQQDRPIEGAARVIQVLKDSGTPVRFLTNTTSLGRRALAEKLSSFGIPATTAEIFCPPAAAAEYLRRKGSSAMLLVLADALGEFGDIEVDDEEPGAVVVGDLEHEWTFERLNRAFRAVLEGNAELIGLGRTRYWVANGGLQLDAGPFIVALEYATGCEAKIFGKPDPAIFEAMVADLGCPADNIAMVGDDIRTDVAAAMAVGIVGVLVRTGKFRDDDLERGITPNLVLGSVADLVAT